MLVKQVRFHSFEGNKHRFLSAEHSQNIFLGVIETSVVSVINMSIKEIICFFPCFKFHLCQILSTPKASKSILTKRKALNKMRKIQEKEAKSSVPYMVDLKPM